MITLKMKYESPDMSRHGIGKVLKQALDAALLNHRKTYLPKHFQTQAISRYPTEYAGATARQRQMMGLRKRFENLTESERVKLRQYLAERMASKTPKTVSGKEGSLDPNNSIPLYETGRMSRIVTSTGPAIFGQDVGNRRMSIQNLPFYADLNKPKGINKQVAMTAIHPEEEEAFQKILDARLQEFFDK